MVRIYVLVVIEDLLIAYFTFKIEEMSDANFLLRGPARAAGWMRHIDFRQANQKNRRRRKKRSFKPISNSHELQFFTSSKKSDPNYSFVLPEQNLGLTIRMAATQIGANWVLMNGIEATPFMELAVKKATEAEISEEIATRAKLEMLEMGSYRFFYPKDYSSLISTLKTADWTSDDSENKIGLSFGADTPLSSILAALGQSLKMTIVADQTISESLSGEISINEAGVREALSGLFLSARIPLDSIQLDTSDEHIFVHSIRNPMRANYQITPMSEEHKQKLTERCTINLINEIVDDSGLNARYKKLSEVAQQISKQMDIPIEYDPTMKDFPITPMYIHDTTRQQALELLVRQWPVPQFGYSFDGDTLFLGRF